jgi:hypothetical protein
MRLPLRILVFLLCASTLALAASGCGGGGGGGTSFSGAKPDTWAATVCGALSDWAQGLQADSQRLGADLRGAKDIKTVKGKFVAFLENAERSTGTMVAKIKGTGPPAVKDGAAIQQQLVSGLEQAQASFTRAVARGKKLSTTDPQAFSTGVTALGQDVEKELTATGEKFNTLGDKYDDKSLNEATSNEPACTKISSS